MSKIIINNFSNELMYNVLDENELSSNLKVHSYELINNNLDSIIMFSQIYLILTIIIIIFGLIGHSLTIFVYSQNRFRRNSSNIYFLCLALNDSAYLIVHFLIQFSSLIDRFEMTCRLINYLNNVLRFTSAYILVAFTLQRLFIVYSPLSNKFKSKKSAWKTVALIYIISLLSNSWILFIFELEKDNKNNYFCNIKHNYESIYFHLTIVYICSIMFIPIIIIFTSNSFLIVGICKSKLNNNRIILSNNNKRLAAEHSSKPIVPIINKKKAFVNKPYFLTMNQLINRVATKANNTRRLTKILILISFSYALLNLPYCISWFMFNFIETSFKLEVLKICELFFYLNYGIYFYIYFLSGSMFRNQLKYSSIFI
jgi:hypothetical protein